MARQLAAPHPWPPQGVPRDWRQEEGVEDVGGLGNAAGGRREFLLSLAKAGISQGIAGLFLEAHPDPDNAKCDGPCALRLEMLEPFLKQVKDLDDFVKAQEIIDIK